MSKKYVYSFGRDGSEGNKDMKDTLGGKGANLAEMCNTGVPVPPGFTVSTEVCNIYFNNNRQVPAEVDEQIKKALTKVEKELGKKLGDPKNPLLMSVRSGAKFSMPGMMNTILNLGLNDETTEGLSQLTGNPRFAYDCYRRFIQMFGEVALGIEMEEFDHVFDQRKAKVKAKLDTDLTAADLQAIIGDYKKIVKKHTGKDFPQDPWQQLTMSRDAVFRSWWADKACYYRKMEKIPDELGTAANIQAMVFGNMGETSGTGVGFTRDPGTGEKVFYGEFLINAQGEDVVAGIRTPQPIEELKTALPEAYKQLYEITQKLEQAYKDVQDFEFTVQEGTLYMLQTRNGKRTGPAAVRIAVEMCDEGIIDKKTAVLRVEPQQLDQLLHPVFDVASLRALPKIAKGIAASPGAAVGRVAFSADDAVTMSKNAPIILLRKETTPDDIHGMDVAKGILTAVGGASHAAVVARGMGGPALPAPARSLSMKVRRSRLSRPDGKKFTVKEGDWLSLDGGAGEVYLGQAKTQDPDPNSPIFSKFMGWADEFRGNFGVRANADIPRDAKAARAFGAEGIGLCRTEHMFFAEDRLPFVQAMILLAMRRPPQGSAEAPADAAQGLRRSVQSDGRLPGCHPYARSAAARVPAEARRPDGGPGQAAVRRHQSQEGDGGAVQELGTDVKSLKTLLPELLEARGRTARVQPDARPSRLPSRHHLSRDHRNAGARDLRSGLQVDKKGIKVIPEVMIPLIGCAKELQHQKAIVERVAKEVLEKAGRRTEVPDRHDDRDSARRVDCRTKLPRKQIFQLRHQRPDPDHDGPFARRLYEVLEGIRGSRSSRPIRSRCSIRKASGS